MAKLGLFFLVVFIFVQICLAAETNSRTARDVGDDAKTVVDKVQDAAKDFFSQDTWDKIVDGVKQFGENAKKVADDVIQKVNDKTPST